MNFYVLCRVFSCKVQIGNSRLLTAYFKELLNDPLQGLMLPSGHTLFPTDENNGCLKPREDVNVEAIP